MKFTKTGKQYTATIDSLIYTISKSPFFTSQWEATRKTDKPGSVRVNAATTFYTLRDAKQWCAEDHERLTA